MITAAMIAYYVVACGLIGLVAYLTARSGVRRSQALVDQQIARVRERYGHTSPLEPYAREPLPELPPPPELRITIARPPESDGAQLRRMAVEVVQIASRLERRFGGEGLDYDPKGTIEEPGRLVLRLVSRSADYEAAERLVAVANELSRLAKQDALAKQDTDIRAKIDRELRPHLSAEVAEHVEGAVVC